MFGAKAEIALAEKGLAFELVMVPFEMATLYQPKHPDVARINPKAQVPVLVHGEVEIFDSTQVFEYLEDIAPEPPLWPRDAKGRARARLLELTSDEVFFPPVVRLMGLQQVPDDPAAVAAREACVRYYAEMEKTLGEQAWLAGPYGFADIAFYMAQIFADRMGAPMPASAPRLLAWRARMSARPAVRKVAGAMALYLRGQNRKLPDFLAALV
jgi:glutathione S-transferase